MHPDIIAYNNSLDNSSKEICDLLLKIISENLPNSTNKVWHRHPVWFLDGNPIVGYANLKNDVQLLFWSGQSFETKGSDAEGKYKAAQQRFTSIEQVDEERLKAWLTEAANIQWNYRDIVKHRGRLDRLK